MDKFNVIDFIYKKRQGHKLTAEEIQQFITGLIQGTIKDYQISAWLMAAFLKGLDIDETAWLTEAMASSGKVLDLSCLGKYVIDKHSTGGVGDKATLIISPLIAACGLPIAKLSGRGLGYTGGTIDKLDAISGFNTNLPSDHFIRQVKEIGIAIGRQTQDLAPADGILYSLRDVTATIDSIPLIAASVLSKKIALGANIIILDVKYGSGAFMATYDDAVALAETMVQIGTKLGKSITAMITGMEQPLGQAIGNSLEVIESIETLKGQGPQDLEDLCVEVAAYALLNAHGVDSIDAGRNIAHQNITNGKALEKFQELLRYQGGDPAIIDDYTKLPAAKGIAEVRALASGYINSCDAKTIAKACKLLGAGRDTKEDPIDLSVGVFLHKKQGDNVEKGDLLASIYYTEDQNLENVKRMMQEGYIISSSPPTSIKLIQKILSSSPVTI